MTSATLTQAVAHVGSTAALSTFTDWLAAGHGALALDVETTGLDVRASGFAVHQIAFAGADGTAVVVDGTDPDLARAALRLAMTHTSKTWWAHNASYERRAIAAAYGIRLTRLRCSMTLVQTVEPNRIGKRGELALKTLRPTTARALELLAARYGDRAGLTARPDGTHWLPDAVCLLDEDDPALLAYVATDAVETARLVAEWNDTLAGDLRACVRRETDVDAAWTWPGIRGYRVDLGMLADEVRALDAARAESFERWGVDLTTTSNASRTWVTQRGIRITDMDGKPTLSAKHYGRAQVPDEARADWDVFVDIRTVATTANKLGEIAGLMDSSGRLYPEIRAIGAHTGRQSIGRPALQNLPERLRPLLLADEGMTLVGCDLDRVEPRVIAALTGDTALTAAVESDVYEELAVAVWGERARGDGESRKVAKTAFLAMAYGQGSKSLGANLGISPTEAQAVIDGLRGGYPTMAAWMDGVKRSARNGINLYTAYGRPIPDNSDGPYRAVNHTIQGTAADLFKAITLDVAKRLGEDALWLPVHDELIVQVPAADADAAVEALREAMSTELKGVPITGTPIILGDRWRKA